MTAKEMFKELGYELKSKFHVADKVFLNYQKDYVISTFSKELSFCKWKPRLFGFLKPYSQDITVSEFKAINKQIEELGWLDEN